MKKILVAIMTLILIFALSACGGQKEKKDAGNKKTEIKTLKSKNGHISVKNYLKGYKVTISSSDDMIEIMAKDKDDPSKLDNGKFVNFKTVDKDGKFFGLKTWLKSFEDGSDYTIETLKSDLEAYCNENPNIIRNPTDVKLGGYDYVRVEGTINAEDGYDYFGIVNNKPVRIEVAGIRDDKKANKTMESVKWNLK